MVRCVLRWGERLERASGDSAPPGSGTRAVRLPDPLPVLVGAPGSGVPVDVDDAADRDDPADAAGEPVRGAGPVVTGGVVTGGVAAGSVVVGPVVGAGDGVAPPRSASRGPSS